MKKIAIDFDDSPPRPEGDWDLVSFNRRYIGYVAREKFLNEDDEVGPELREKLEDGRAHLLRYTEHGPPCMWQVLRDGDFDRADGILLSKYSDDDSLEDRRASADSYCELYTAWANGYVYVFTVYDGFGDPIESLGGYYGTDDGVRGMFETIGEFVGPTESVKWTGKALQYLDFDIEKLFKRMGEDSPEVVTFQMTTDAWATIRAELSRTDAMLGDVGRLGTDRREKLHNAMNTVREVK